MIKGVRRVSIAVAELADALVFYRDVLGLQAAGEIELPGQGVKLVRLRAGEVEIELMQPLDSTATLARFLERRGPGLHHISIEVDDIELEMRTLLARGVDLIDREPRDGPDGRIAFVQPRSAAGVLIELTEPRRAESSRPETFAAGSENVPFGPAAAPKPGDSSS
jgi:methylmalonyl-CoA epimerase